MSPAPRKISEPRLRGYAEVFSALGDSTRLSLLSKLADRQPRSISQLTEDTSLSRQAVTKHLRVLEDAGLVRSRRRGREAQFAADMKPFADAQEYLQFVTSQWDTALGRLKSFVE